MSTLQVTTTTTSNGTTNHTIQTGNTTGPQIILYSGGNISLSGNSTANGIVVTNTEIIFNGVTFGGLAVVQTITDAASQTFDAQNGKTTVARQNATADRTLIAPTNAMDGQKVMIEFTAANAGRTLTLTTGSSGAFRYGSDITGLTQTASGKTDRIGVIYNSTAQRWDVVAVIKGF